MTQAVALLAEQPQLQVVRQASLYESEPVGIIDQPWFLNTLIEIGTILSPAALLQCCKATERTLGRIARQRWGPREIDVDIIMYGNWIVRTPELIIPHPQMKVRNFVLSPLLELLPDAVDPATGHRVADIAAQLKDLKKVELSRKKY